MPSTSVARRNSSLVGFPSATAVSSMVVIAPAAGRPRRFLTLRSRNRLGEPQQRRAPEERLDLFGGEQTPLDQQLANGPMEPLGVVEELGDFQIAESWA